MTKNKKTTAITFFTLIAFALVLLPGCKNAEQANNNKGASEVPKLQKEGTLIVGTNLPFEPMVYYEGDEIVGFDADLIREIGAELDLAVEMKDVPWDDIFDRLDQREFDVIIDGITITSERMDSWLFSDPYLNGGQVIVVRKENTDINGPEDLEDKTVAVLENTTCEEAAREHAKEDNVIEYPSQDVVTKSLIDGDADAMIVDYPVAATIVKSESSLKIIEGQITEEYYGIATQKDNEVLMSAVNSALRNIKRDGRLDAMEDKWLK